MDWASAQVSRTGEMESQALELGEMVCARHLIPAGFGDAFHVRAGHLAEVLEDAELIEFTRSEDYRRKAEHLEQGSE